MSQQYPQIFGGKVIVIAGPPGSGKGTQSQLLADACGMVHISTGDVFREEVRKGTELGLAVKQYLDQGCFVPDEIVINYLKDRIRAPDVKERGCILDGYPRTSAQAQQLVKYVTVYRFILLTVPDDEVLVRRARDRRLDPDTGKIYNLASAPPPADLADVVVQRPYDSSEDAFRVRLSTYHGQVRRVLTSGCFQNVLVEIDGMRPAPEVASGVLRALTEDLPPLPVPLTRGSGQGEGGGMAAEAEASKLCAVCLTEPADFLCTPCGHQCGCQACLIAIKDSSGVCPICRTPIASVQRVFAAGVVDVVSTNPDASQQGGAAAEAVAGMQSMTTVLDPRSKPAVDEEWPDEEDSSVPMAGAGEGAAGAAEQDSGVKLEINPVEDMTSAQAEEEAMIERDVMIRIVPPEFPKKRVPVDLCCCVDISASMRAPAYFENEQGERESNGLKVMNIVKHSIMAVINFLHEDDTLAIVTFNEKATTVGSWQMNEAGKTDALAKLKQIRATGRTNIWGGLHESMEALRNGISNGYDAGRKKSIFLLTDGLPNVIPPRGHVTEVQEYKDLYPEFSFSINTFGFGYSLDSQLLVDVAKEGHGTFAFIPDALIVGTTFVDAIANVVSKMAMTSTVSISPRNGSELAGPARGCFASDVESWGINVDFGPILFGQSRDLIVPMKIPASLVSSDAPYLDVVLTFPYSSDGCETEARVVESARDRRSSVAACVALCRSKVVEVGFGAVADGVAGKGKTAVASIDSLCSYLDAQAKIYPDESRLNGLVQDVSGRTSKALKGQERFKRWGKHYILALMRSHMVQQCTNFMDPGIQFYGGAYFRQQREAGDRAFLTLPPPEAEDITVLPNGVEVNMSAPTNTYRAPPPAPVNMNTYYAGAGGGCFGGDSILSVLKTSKTHHSNHAVVDDDVKSRWDNKPIKHLKKGDVVRIAGGGTAQVECVVIIERDPAKSLIQVGSMGCEITPRHPIRIAGAWTVPRDVSKVMVPNPTGQVYNVILDRGHILLVGGKECLTWGHGISEEPVRHPFLGTERCLIELKKMHGWSRGLVHVKGVFRHTETNQVAGFT